VKSAEHSAAIISALVFGSKVVNLLDSGRIQAMPTVRTMDREIDLALRVPYFGDEADKLSTAIPELQAHLKSRYPVVEEVKLAYKNPGPDIAVQSWFYLHEAWILIALLNPLTQKIMSNIADDAYKWVKKRFKIKRGHNNPRKALRRKPRRKSSKKRKQV
jgi:hypothetical protein